MKIILDKKKATQSARNLADHLAREHTLKLGHQQAMTALAATLGYGSLHAFSQQVKTAPAAAGDAGTAPELTSASDDALLAELRRRGNAAVSVSPSEMVEILGLSETAAQHPTMRAWLDSARGSLQAELAYQAARTLKSYDDLPDLQTPTGGTPADDLPDGQIANADYGRVKSYHDSDMADYAIDQCHHRDIELEQRADGKWVWYMPDAKNPAKRVPGRAHDSEGLAALAACAAFGIEPNVHCVLNHYHCEDCDEIWESPWFCGVDEECPSCNADIEANETQSLVIDEPDPEADI